jgi:ankyrin repeat protein
LLSAAINGDVEAFRRIRALDPLLTRGIEDVRDYSGRTVLHLAAWHGRTEVLEVLLSSNPLPPTLSLSTLLSKNGNTVLHSAVSGGNPATVEWLAFHPALQVALNSRNIRGMTPADVATESGFRQIAATLRR